MTGGVLSHARRGALTGLGWGAAAGAVNAAALLASTRDILEAPGALIVGVAQAAAVDAAALWLLLSICGAVVGFAIAVGKGRLRAPGSSSLYSSLAVGAIAFALIVRAWLAHVPPSAKVWVGSVAGSAAIAAVALVILPRVARRWRWRASAGPGAAAIIALALAGAWAAAYVRWGEAHALWMRAVIVGVGLAVLAVISILAVRRLGTWLDGVRWWGTAVAILPVPALALAFALLAFEARSRPSVILITVDALRADRLGCYGSKAGLTPNLDAFAQEAILFERAFVSAPWTANSFAAMLSGRYVHECGMAPVAPDPPRHTPASHFRGRRVGGSPLLAELLQEAGYTTAAELANPYLDSRFEWNRGFDYFRNEYGAPPEAMWLRPMAPHPLVGWRHASMVGWFARRPYTRAADKRMWGRGPPGRDDAEDLTRVAIKWLRQGEWRSPIFLWVHYMDPHVPYGPPDAPAREKAIVDNVDKPLVGTAFWAEKGEPPPQRSQEVRVAARTLYDAEVRYCDRWVGELFDCLREVGVYERALIVITADHGEELWEHGALAHGRTLYDEVLRVPLLIKLPGAPSPARVARQVRLLDLTPTALEVTGVRYRGAQRGRSLLAALEESDAERPLFAEGLYWGDELKGVRTERYKVIYHTATGRVEVYDLRADPGETRDLSRDEKIAVREREILRAWMTGAVSAAASAAGAEFTPEMREKLRSLGYTAD